MCDLGELRELSESRGQGNLGPLQLPGPPAAVPLLVCAAEGREHVRRQVELLAKEPGDAGVLAHHPVDVTTSLEHELECDSEPMQRRVPGPDESERGRRAAQAPELVVVLPRLQLDVVAEPLRLLVRIGVAADVDEQRRVVDIGARLVAEADPLRKAQRDQALPQDVLHRLPETQIDTERERGNELGQPH